MAIKASNQMTLIDLTDGYSVILTNEAYTFLGTTNSVSGTQVTTTMVQATCGAEVVPCSVDTSAITLPTGLSIVSDAKFPTPTLTITATSALKTGGSIDIPVTIGDLTIHKTFSYSIAFKGTNGSNGTSVSVSNTDITYQVSSSGTTVPTGTWSTSVPSVGAGKYLWTKTVVTYSDGKSTTSYGVSRNGTNGTSPTVSGTTTEYQQSTSGTAIPTGTWSTTAPAAVAGKYIWTRTTTTYSDGKTAVSYNVSRNGTNGTNGSDALALVIISSAGTIFKNTNIATTLTAHVYKGGAEVTGSALSALGSIKWYKDGGATAVATGTSLTISAGDVANKANYTAQLEG